MAESSIQAIINTVNDNPLGVISLLAILISAIAMRFFVKALERTRVFVFLILIMGITGLSYSIINPISDRKEEAEPKEENQQIPAVNSDTNCSMSRELSGINFAGNNIFNYLYNIESAKDCQSHCEREDSCMAWGWATPQFKKERAKECWLKSAKSDPSPVEHVVSGYKICN